MAMISTSKTVYYPAISWISAIKSVILRPELGNLCQINDKT